MLIRHICYALVAFIGGAAISSGYFAFISLIGVFPKLAEKVKGNRHYMLVECLLAGNIVYIFNIRIPFAIPGLAFVTLLGGIFTGCLVGALAEVLNVFPIISRRFSIRRYIPYIIYMVAAGKLVGSVLGLISTGLV